MATFDRTTIVRGPCKITYDGATFYSKGGVTLAMNQSTFDKEVDGYGMVGKAKTDMKHLQFSSHLQARQSGLRFTEQATSHL